MSSKMLKMEPRNDLRDSKIEVKLKLLLHSICSKWLGKCRVITYRIWLFLTKQLSTKRLQGQELPSTSQMDQVRNSRRQDLSANSSALESQLTTSLKGVTLVEETKTSQLQVFEAFQCHLLKLVWSLTALFQLSRATTNQIFISPREDSLLFLWPQSASRKQWWRPSLISSSTVIMKSWELRSLQKVLSAHVRCCASLSRASVAAPRITTIVSLRTGSPSKSSYTSLPMW